MTTTTCKPLTNMSKNPWTSKINWSAVGIIILEWIKNPDLWTQLANNGLLSQAGATFAIQILALLVIIFRTYFTQLASPPSMTEEVPPNIPVDVVTPQLPTNSFTGKIEP